MVASNIRPQLFLAGNVVVTPLALEYLGEAGESADRLVARHVTGDWGHVSYEHRKVNEWGVATNDRIVSMYYLWTGKRVLVVTDADRSKTTVMQPDEFEE